jgi:GTP:adenosylcobinamide-phosphate guanylyltransferase
MVDLVGIVIMCAGFSKRFGEINKCLFPLPLEGKPTIIELLLTQLKKIAGNLRVPILIACNK